MGRTRGMNPGGFLRGPGVKHVGLPEKDGVGAGVAAASEIDFRRHGVDTRASEGKHRDGRNLNSQGAPERAMAERNRDPRRNNPVLILTGLGYVLVIGLIWMDEVFDLPHRLLGAPATPFRWSAAVLHSGVVTLVTILVGAVMYRLVRGRRAANADLKRLATHYQVLADHTYDWEFWVGGEGQFLHSSPSCHRISGHHPEEFAADPGLLGRLVHPGDRAAFEEHRRHAHQERTAGEIRFRIIRKDGAVRWIGHVCQPVFGTDGTPLGVRGSNRDITAVRHAEVALETIASHLRRAQEVARLGSWDLDLVTGQLFWSDEVYRIFGVAGGTPLDYRTFLGMVHEEDREAVERMWREALGGGAYDIEHRIRVDGRDKWVREAAEVEFGEDGRAIRGIGIVQDITARREAEEEVARLDLELAHVTRVATLGEFAAALAHELNQPLAAILTNAQAGLRFMDRDELEPGEIREIFTDIAADDQRARDVILRLRELTRKPLGDRPPEPLAVNPLVAGVLGIVRGEISLRGVELATELAGDVRTVSANGVRIQQALLNLIQNALEAMESTGQKRLTVRTGNTEDGRVEISVIDTGPGFAGAGGADVFRPFFTTKKDGMGMGLAISRAAVEAHGGSLRAFAADGGGARVVISLPAAGEVEI